MCLLLSIRVCRSVSGTVFSPTKTYGQGIKDLCRRRKRETMPTSVDHKSTHAHTQPDTHSAHTPIPQRGRSVAKTLLFTSISNNDNEEKAGNSSKPQENPWQSSSICISCAAEPKVHAHSPTHTHTHRRTHLSSRWHAQASTLTRRMTNVRVIGLTLRIRPAGPAFAAPETKSRKTDRPVIGKSSITSG